VISFEYAAMSYQSLDRIEYAYMMEGFDKGWNYVGSQRKATYTNLAPGTYRFLVKATNVHGEWGEKTAIVRVVVRPPFYLTPLAYALYLLAFTAIAFFARRWVLTRARKKNEERVERLQVQREKEFYNKKIEFFTMMAHEIRTPLSLIVAPLEKLIGEEEWKPEVKEQLSLMNQNSDRLLNLVNQLLDFRRIESDIYTIRIEEVEIISFIHSLHSRFSAISYQKGIRFSMATSINRLVVQADPEALTKILTNLLINAFKFAKSQVELRVNEDEKYDGIEHFCISVKDDGNGIPADQVEKIFNPFYKVPGDHNANYGGTGIGLALAKSLAEKHGGRLTVQSKPQRETVFTLCIPYEATAGAAITVTEQMEPEENEEQKPLVLVVEDDNSLLRFIAKSLHGEGYRALTCGNGAEALQQLKDAAVDLIISDVMMPEIDGIELCRRVKANINFSHIPLILLTAQGNSDAEIAGIESGADAYISKPFRWKHLAATARQLIESRQALKNKFGKQPFTDAGTLTTNNNDRKFLEKLTLIIEERIIDPQLSVEELSREMAMSRSSLHKKLKGISGQVPNEFIRLIRLKNAAKMLSSGDYRISEVGYLSGFNSASYFSKCFLQQFGVTPTDFLETHHPKKISDVEDANL
jgi:signal transduction histidine kinase/DNA-binding response OmpR family regulator